MRSSMRKKLIVCVLPGDELVRANPCVLVRVFNKLDLPMFDRPQKAISGRWSRGKSSGRVALLTNRAELIFTTGGREAGISCHCNRVSTLVHDRFLKISISSYWRPESDFRFRRDRCGCVGQ